MRDKGETVLRCTGVEVRSQEQVDKGAEGLTLQFSFMLINIYIPGSMAAGKGIVYVISQGGPDECGFVWPSNVAQASFGRVGIAGGPAHRLSFARISIRRLPHSQNSAGFKNRLCAQ